MILCFFLNFLQQSNRIIYFDNIYGITYIHKTAFHMLFNLSYFVNILLSSHLSLIFISHFFLPFHKIISNTNITHNILLWLVHTTYYIKGAVNKVCLLQYPNLIQLFMYSIPCYFNFIFSV